MDVCVGRARVELPSLRRFRDNITLSLTDTDISRVQHSFSMTIQEKPYTVFGYGSLIFKVRMGCPWCLSCGAHNETACSPHRTSYGRVRPNAKCLSSWLIDMN